MKKLLLIMMALVTMTSMAQRNWKVLVGATYTQYDSVGTTNPKIGCMYKDYGMSLSYGKNSLHTYEIEMLHHGSISHEYTMSVSFLQAQGYIKIHKNFMFGMGATFVDFKSKYIKGWWKETGEIIAYELPQNLYFSSYFLTASVNVFIGPVGVTISQSYDWKNRYKPFTSFGILLRI